MKTPTVLLIAAVLTTIVIGIGVTKSPPPEPPPEPPKDLPITTYVDPETKCEYLVNIQGGITPRVAANGLQYGCTYDYEVSQ